jgi:hypothetical protein
MTNNYVKTAGGAFKFFDDRDPLETLAAWDYASVHATGTDPRSVPPCYTGVAVYRSLSGYTELLEIGEVRERLVP